MLIWARPRRRAPAMADRIKSDNVLDVAGIETCYGLSQVLFGVSLSIAPGEMVTLMGRNGMGKTTTVRSILGLTPARAGTIRFARSEEHTSELQSPCNLVC